MKRFWLSLPLLLLTACTDQTQKATAPCANDPVNVVAPISLGTKKPIQIKILVEPEMGAADTFRLSAAEVLNQLFPGRFEVGNAGNLEFYVYGTSTDREGQNQSFEISIQSDLAAPVESYHKHFDMDGTFVFERAGGTVSGTNAYKAQYFKETAYKVVSRFLRAYDERMP